MKRPFIYLLALGVVLVFAFVLSASAQQIRVARIQPDAMATGMTMTMEILAPAADTGAFGTDGIYLPSERLAYINAADSIHVIFGPVCVSWNGRVMQVPVMAPRIAGTSTLGTIQFIVVVGNRKSTVEQLSLVQPQTSLTVVGSGVIGGGSIGTLTRGNTLVVDSIVLAGTDSHGHYEFTFDTQDPDTSVANPRYHPMSVLALHGVRLTDVELSVSATTKDGGPGGGGGGGGYVSSGGAGYTGGGSDSIFSNANTGSGGGPTASNGGASTTGVLGGATSGLNSDNPDQGAGGGTGCPYGSSGVYSSGNEPSRSGGFGGASAGGETAGQVYGGGGGGFAADGAQGDGQGSNQGLAYGGRFLMPMMGGSGGGSGNAQQDTVQQTGSGGGGGGAITIVSFTDVSLERSWFSARGANGSAGVWKYEGGGGGGSGGGIYIASRGGVRLSESNIEANGGLGGVGGRSGDTISGAGGAGAIGRIRLDGRYNDTCSSCQLTGAVTSGPVIVPADSQLHGPANVIGGVSGSKTQLLDSIRVFYRNHHSPWQYVDTVRDTAGTQPNWSAVLPVGHDSLLFVVAYQKVRQPHADLTDNEPEWLTGHLASAAVRVVPTPHPVAHTDTLDFGCTLLSDSVQAPVFVTDLGEAPFIVDAVTISDPVHFQIVRDTSRFDGYATDSIVIRYIPRTGPRKDTAILRLISKTDTLTVVLVGCSIDRDERLLISKRTLDFGRVHVGDCPTLSFYAKSVGNDPITVRTSNLVEPPFKVIAPVKDTVLAKPDSVKIVVQFCPTDSGDFRKSFMLTDRRDSIVVSGTGTIRLLKPQALTIGATLCPNACDTARLVLHSNGNDALRLNGITGGAMLSPPLPMTIPARTDTEIVVQYCNFGPSSDTIRFLSNADSSSDAVILLTPLHIAFDVTGKTSFGPVCLSESDSSAIVIARSGNDTLLIDSVRTPSGVFSANPTTSGRDSVPLEVHFHPILAGTFTDSIVVVVHSGTCDSLITIRLVGIAHSVAPLFSSTVLEFDPIDTGACTDSSIRITLPCGSDTMTIAGIAPPFSLVQPSDGKLILTRDSSTDIIVRYCPLVVGRDSLVFSVQDGGATTPITLLGSARSAGTQPRLHFSLERVAVQAGTPFTYRISIDTAINTEGVDSVHAILRYDPLLLEAISASSPVWTLSGSERKPGEFEIAAHGSSKLANGVFASVQMLPFFAAKNSTDVTLTDIETFAPSASTSDSGNVTVADCSNLSGNIIIAGPYSLDRVLANPVSSSLDLDVTIGAAGTVDLRVYDLTGAVALKKTTSELSRGKHRLAIDVSSLPSGVYRLTLESLGWQGGTTFIVQH